MGGLRKYMPMTFATFAAATAAIIGFPLTSGFFSKDEILYKAFTNQTLHPLRERYTQRGIEFFTPPTWVGPVLYWAAVLAATMTAFYMCRLLFLTFFGEFKGWAIGEGSHDHDHDGHGHGHDHHGDHGHGDHHHDDLTVPGPAPHESPWPMVVPLVILAALSLFGGFLNPGLLHNAGILHMEPINAWLEPVFEAAGAGVVDTDTAHAKVWLLALPGFGAFAIGSGVAYWMYVLQGGAPAKALAESAPGLYRLVYDKWRIDELYEVTVLSAVESLADTSAMFDKYVVDGLLGKASAAIVQGLGAFLRVFQNGVIHTYGALMVIGLAGTGWFFVMPHTDVAVEETGADYTVSVSPGPAYTYRWDADGDGKLDDSTFGDRTSVKVTLEPGASKTVRVEVRNAFGIQRGKEVVLSRPNTSNSKMEVGQR
jgi:NADH-quinone oxidoreductase subunit L